MVHEWKAAILTTVPPTLHEWKEGKLGEIYLDLAIGFENQIHSFSSNFRIKGSHLKIFSDSRNSYLFMRLRRTLGFFCNFVLAVMFAFCKQVLLSRLLLFTDK